MRACVRGRDPRAGLSTFKMSSNDCPRKAQMGLASIELNALEETNMFNPRFKYCLLTT